MVGFILGFTGFMRLSIMCFMFELMFIDTGRFFIRVVKTIFWKVILVGFLVDFVGFSGFCSLFRTTDGGRFGLNSSPKKPEE